MTFPEYAPQEPSSTFMRAFLRAIFSDDRDVSAHNREDMFRALADDPGDPERSEKEVLGKISTWGRHRSGRLLLLTSGRLAYTSEPGRGPEAGDRVASLHGLKVPCLLRKSEDGEGWLYVTDIYVDGMMYGEGKSRRPESSEHHRP